MTAPTVATMRQPMAPRKEFGVRAVHRDPFHVAAAWTYRSLCSRKRLASAWQIHLPTAGRYRNGIIIGALTRLLWELVLLEREGIRTTRVLRLLRRAALRERRMYERRQAARYV